jgi:hypothetical protein
MPPFAHRDTKTLVTPNAPPRWGAREEVLSAAGCALDVTAKT